VHAGAHGRDPAVENASHPKVRKHTREIDPAAVSVHHHYSRGIPSIATYIPKSVNIRGKSIQLQYQCITTIPEVSRASQLLTADPAQLQASACAYRHYVSRSEDSIDAYMSMDRLRRHVPQLFYGQSLWILRTAQYGVPANANGVASRRFFALRPYRADTIKPSTLFRMSNSYA